MSEAALAANGTPTVVFFHGDGTDGPSWAGVISTLHRAGEAIVTPANSLRDISGTIDELRRVVDAIAESLRDPEPTVDIRTAPEIAILPPGTKYGSKARGSFLTESLSGREVEVLELVAEGLTNSQLAGRLFLSPKTVSSHLVSIFGKLGVTSRVSATRFAIEHGLV